MLFVTYHLVPGTNKEMQISQGPLGVFRVVNIAGTVEVYRGSPLTNGNKIATLVGNDGFVYSDGNLWLNNTSGSAATGVVLLG